ncbi:signal peptidase I [Streptomyces sp. B1866]|uniref:signal peptidase I n=1 Tax=Streptomyces sp. B1866 TaxID=3075431 RepID=UPI00288CA2FA|nr:signal peptidase I [Streptomyces sp. B1866]MDT3399884.1 signal peptidase I [Streptomyces sp. B1866]
MTGPPGAGARAADARDGGRGRLVSGLVVALGCLLFLGGAGWGAIAYKPYSVPSDSMAPTLRQGARLLAQRIDGDEVRRGDVVIFRDPLWGQNLSMAKRVVAVGGDTVACCDRRGRLTVDGRPVEEPYLHARGPASVTRFSATVPADRLFVMGDHRADSVDSRAHLGDGADGSIPRDAVRARVDAVVWPLSDLGTVGRPDGFADLPGGVSQPGPLRVILALTTVGAALVLGGALYGPVARAAARRRARGRPRREAVAGG